jgi:uncharacterized protein HemX
VRAETRHQMKQDRFSRVTIDAAERTAHWSVEHKNKLIVAGVIVLVVAGIAAGTWYYLNQQDQKASLEMSQAVRTLNTPVRPPNMGRNKQAVDLYKQLAAKPASTVGKVTAQMELAATYQSDNQPLEAKRIYEIIQKENPASEVAQMATTKLQELK